MLSENAKAGNFVLRTDQKESKKDLVTNLNEYFIELLKITGTEEINLQRNGIQKSSLTFKDIVNITQKNWLRPAGTERWDLKDTLLLKIHRAEIINLLELMGFIREIKPSRKNYDSILILGASNISLVKRINYLYKLWQEGIRYKKTYLLSGEMNTRAELNNINEIRSLHLTTETELMEALYKIKCLYKGMRPSVTIRANKNKKGCRPNTEDTLRAWLAKKDVGKNILVISNQPFVLYQGKVVERVLRPLYNPETVGPMVDPSSICIAVILDSLARYMYECYYGVRRATLQL